jgi:hypothetical protein
MPSFDVVSEVDMQEVRNAVDQTSRELATRFDFKGTGAAIEQADTVLTITAPTEDRLAAVRQVLEEKLVRRDVSLKALDYAKVEEASGGTVRQRATIVAGISSDKAREVNQPSKPSPLWNTGGGRSVPTPERAPTSSRPSCAHSRTEAWSAPTMRSAVSVTRCNAAPRSESSSRRCVISASSPSASGRMRVDSRHRDHGANKKRSRVPAKLHIRHWDAFRTDCDRHRKTNGFSQLDRKRAAGSNVDPGPLAPRRRIA